ncbi:hypothetical protein [Acidithiobacillus ferrooxidans]|uniref:Uncharacterized protein n=1 Tax=Acidithiobacillus ferrooxidans TaxID=920 RepID=A0A2W1K629_ACIFR|nr:hypothetical protein [Acidithiobacillus ferrooxidans]MBU2819401.1 hypothetical protein [Acidithiobacillus ferrooxidans]MCR1344062.1 hypothetical protein [Acidithiobacillus ferrooxidans]PZD82436.1 hypothetical protein DN052_05305 [Acidithiobacillus ferrooxidans]QLK41290.1 hypothetical protein FE661_03260 [Acidithiobacillus ferrooxidans]QZT53231.1 hypothetical protein K7B00_03255 [Acidithiobacillus ferrooxidans]
MWKKLADKYRNDAAYRAAIDVLADRYGDGMAFAIKATAMAEREDRDSFWLRLAKHYREKAVYRYRVVIDYQAARGYNVACAIKAAAFAV